MGEAERCCRGVGGVIPSADGTVRRCSSTGGRSRHPDDRTTTMTTRGGVLADARYDGEVAECVDSAAPKRLDGERGNQLPMMHDGDGDGD